MLKRRVVSCLAAVGLCLGMSVSGASASAGPATGERSIAPTGAQDQWWRSGYYSIAERCYEDRKAKHHRDIPTNPTSGCFRNDNGYYFYWWGSFWD